MYWLELVNENKHSAKGKFARWLKAESAENMAAVWKEPQITSIPLCFVFLTLPILCTISVKGQKMLFLCLLGKVSIIVAAKVSLQSQNFLSPSVWKHNNVCQLTLKESLSLSLCFREPVGPGTSGRFDWIIGPRRRPRSANSNRMPWGQKESECHWMWGRKEREVSSEKLLISLCWFWVTSTKQKMHTGF